MELNKTNIYGCIKRENETVAKGGEYRILDLAKGAGKSREYGDIIVYYDLETGQLFYRKQEDFEERMEIKKEIGVPFINININGG